MRSIAVFASLAACLLAFPAADARGDLLDLPILKPDIMAQYIQMDYVKDAWLFTLSGEARAFDRGGGLPSLDITNNGTFSLTATVNNSGTLTGGTVTVSGEISALPPPTNPGDPLLVANLTGFEYRYNVGVGGSFAFLFESPGGSLKDYWGSKPGLILFDDMGSTFLGSFASDFSNYYSGVTDVTAGKGDVTVVPAPGAAVMFLEAVAVLAGCGLTSSRQLLRRGRQ